MPSTELDRAYDLCKRINAHHGKTYYFSTLFFPPEIRRSVHALYGFVRYPDEIVDNPQPGDDPRRGLTEYRDATRMALKMGRSDNPVLHAFADVAARYRISEQYPLAFLDAMAMDLTRSRYETFDDLKTYTYGSASVVGLMMCRVMGVTNEQALVHAHDLGLAMQLTNFWRDIGEDWRDRQRIYIPQEEMRRFGYTETMLANGVVNDAFRDLMRFQIARAREYYASADLGMSSIPPRSQLPVKLARHLYAQILDKIEENNYDVFARRARTTAFEKATAFVRLRMSGAS
ncbi:phytoene desaturase [Capsulimonas corticalis]|uniref:Phytoene desaturase n=1 Tax=Capsulimonas corticalis TaxID=2219043 RepID=A0A402D248_9BACT|nr:phytoene/squalene synthase family protein [Capsulimonas corticalis]BDI30112.1 phytoene desaturase [Capsulimonas corticalis]